MTQSQEMTSTDRNGADDALLEVKDLKMHFPVTSGIVFQRKVADVKAVDGISFTIKRGETLGLVGESGCGKTTAGRCILQLYKPTAGDVMFDGERLNDLDTRRMRAMRRQMQIIFQDPYGSLNPRMTCGDIVGEHDVIFAGQGERIVLRHMATDRMIFARGALRAALWGQGRPPGQHDMIDVLGLAR